MQPTNEINARHSGTFSLGSDLPIHRLGYGAMRVTGKGVWGPPRNEADAIKVLQATLDVGINFIDTADSYGPNVSEELIAKALYPYAEGLLIATKGGLERPGPDQWSINGRPDHLEEALKGSLQRLRVEQIDLYQLHRFDPKVPADEFLDKLKELQQQGYIRHLGLSEVSVAQIQQAQEYFEVVSIQNKYSITDRKWEKELDWTAEQGIGFIPWYPLDAGKLNHEVMTELEGKYDATTYQIALAWLLARSDNMLPIPGTSSVDHLQENTAAAHLELEPEDLARLSAM